MKKIVFLGILSAFMFSCGSKTEVYIGQEKLSKGLTLYQKGDYKKAKEELKNAIFKSEGLTPAQLMEARFALADSYYNREEYVDAIVEFEEFIALFPTSPKIPEALYKLAMSYMFVSPDYKRDLTYVNKAEEKAQEIIDSYPDSKYVAAAKEIIKKVNEIKAKHTLYIAETYEKYGKPYSAAVYYQEAYSKYKDYIQKDYVIYKLAYNLINSQYQYTHEIENYKQQIKELEKKIDQEKDLEAKNVLINRKKLLEQHLNNLIERINNSKEKAKEMIASFDKAFPESPYKQQMKNLENESKLQNLLKKLQF
ncbi:outer membrane protein assembly factor BamD [Sulfurihydrogenibium subterraneum]|uniref:outer membrane protein assembly factor BamD n=1 Tax=Sulfurihydrogenibium subterraneum TaxID=171121 RepID=UPI00048F127F|nr:outer membrane protein assembly factor BamD [Sulfurihydrogenibium subterraneum]